MRSLIIENNSLPASALKNALQSFGECEEAIDRESAMLIFEESLAAGQPFDLITVDMAMQDTQGISIIKEMRMMEGQHSFAPDQNACIIVIATLPKRQLVTDCIIDGCDGFFDKNFEVAQIMEKLKELNLVANLKEPKNHDSAAISSTQLIGTVTTMLDRGDLSLAPVPKIAMRIRQLVSLNADIEAIEDLLRHDLSISTMLIKLSNSAAYGGFGKNASVGQAVRRLGIYHTLEAVMSVCCRAYFVTTHPAYKQHVENLWWHSLACAHATSMILDFKQLTIQEDLFSLGLLHDIGKLVLIQAAGDLQRPKKSDSLIESEDLNAMLNAHHRQVGAKLLECQGYPKGFAALIQTDGASGDELAATVKNVLNQADLLAIASGFKDGAKNDAEVQEVLTNCGIPSQIIEALKAQIVSRIEELRYLFG